MADKMDNHITEDEIEATSRMDFVRNWVEEVRALASKWNSEEQNSSSGDALEFQVGYLGSLLDLMWEEVQEEDSASSEEISSYMSEMTNWISKVHVQRYSAKKDVLMPLKSSVMVCNDAPASPAYQVFDEMLEPIDDSEMSLNSPELLASMNASSDISVFFEARESDEKGGMVPLRSPEEVHHQPEVQVAGYDTPIFPSKIAISALLCPSGSRTRTTNFHPEDPIDLESIISDSLSIYEAHSAIKTGKNELLCAEEAFTVISTLDGVSPFLKVTPCFLVPSVDTSESFVNLKAFYKEEAIRSSNASAEQMMSSPDFVLSPSAYYMFDEMPSRELHLFPCSCKLMDDLMGGVGHYNVLWDSYTFVFDPGKPMADWLIDHKSAVFIVSDAWLCTFGISIWSFKHDFSQFFVFDPGIACTVVHCGDENAQNQPAVIIFHLVSCTLLSISMILSFQPQRAAASTCLSCEFCCSYGDIGLGNTCDFTVKFLVSICGIWSR